MLSPTTLARRFARSSPPRSATHVLEVGAAVRLKRAAWKSGDVYHVTARLPAIDEMPQYRIHSDEERFERVARQDELEDATASAGDAPIDKAFGREQAP
jgi:hypothetical protein